MLEIDPKSGVAFESTMKDEGNEMKPELKNNEQENKMVEGETGNKYGEKEENIEHEEPTKYKEDVPVEVEAKTGVSFSSYAGGWKAAEYCWSEKEEHAWPQHQYIWLWYIKDQNWEAPSKATKVMYQMVIDSDMGMMVQLVIVFSGLTMSMVRKIFDEGLGAPIKKPRGGKNEELTKKIMGEASNGVTLTPGSVIEISRLPGYKLKTKVLGEIVSIVESELLCRAYIYMYLGEDPFDKEA